MAHSKSVRGPYPQPFDQAADSTNLTQQPTHCKSLNPNILPIKHLFSRFCRTSRPDHSANCHACNDLEEISRKSHPPASAIKSLFFNILPASYLDSRFCAVRSLADRTNSNELNTLNTDAGKIRKQDSHDSSAFHSQAFGCGILGASSPAITRSLVHSFLGARDSRLAANP